MRRALRLLPALVLLLSVAACQQDFDSQYAETEKKISDNLAKELPATARVEEMIKAALKYMA